MYRQEGNFCQITNLKTAFENSIERIAEQSEFFKKMSNNNLANIIIRSFADMFDINMKYTRYSKRDQEVRPYGFMDICCTDGTVSVPEKELRNTFELNRRNENQDLGDQTDKVVVCTMYPLDEQAHMQEAILELRAQKRQQRVLDEEENRRPTRNTPNAVAATPLQAAPWSKESCNNFICFENKKTSENISNFRTSFVFQFRTKFSRNSYISNP